MKILKAILIGLLALVIIYFVACFFTPKKMQVQKTVTIHAPAEDIYAQVTDFHTWNDWSPWNQMDPEMQSEFSEKMGGVGAWTSWESQNQYVGSGRQEIVEAEKPQYAKYEMTFGESTDKNYAEFKLNEKEEGVTEVTWTMLGAESAFYMRPMNLLMKPVIENNYIKGLDALKEKMESGDYESHAQKNEHPSNPHIMKVKPIQILSIKDSTNAQGISDKLGELYSEIITYINSSDSIQQAGMPLAIYHFYSPDRVILEAGIPYSGNASENGRIKVTETPSGQTVMKVHYGAYASSETSHNQIYDYVQANNMEIVGAPWEVYANDPTTVSEAEIETHIYYPIKTSEQDSLSSI